jgi:hypothetical protein
MEKSCGGVTTFVKVVGDAVLTIGSIPPELFITIMTSGGCLSLKNIQKWIKISEHYPVIKY